MAFGDVAGGLGGLTQLPVNVARFDPVGLLPAPVASFFDAGQGGNQPIQVKASANEQALINKYSDLSSIVNQLPPELRSALIDYDTKRVAGGSAPITKPETLSALQAIQSGKTLAEPHRSVLNFLGNSLGDLKAIIGSVPRLFDPRTWIHEAEGVAHLPSEIAKSRAQGADPLQALFSAPGIRMIPGSFVAGNVLHPTELARHPLFTGLDLLPAAKELGVTEAIGTKLAPVREAIADTRVGRTLTEAFGNRDVWRTAEAENSRIRGVLAGKIAPATEKEAIAREAVQVNERYAIEPARRIELTREAELGTRDNWTPNELAYMNELREVSDKFAHVNEREGELGSIFSPATGKYEFYPRTTADAIRTQRARRETFANGFENASAMRDEYLHPTGKLEPDQFYEAMHTATTIDNRKLALANVRATLHALDANGHDTTALRTVLSTVQKNNRPLAGFLDRFDEWYDANMVTGDTALGGVGAQPPRRSLIDIVDELDKHKRHVMANRLKTAIVDKNTTRITDTLDKLSRQSNSRLPIMDDPTFIADVRSLRDRYQFENSTGKTFTPERAAKRRAIEQRDSDILPAPDRFQTIIEHNVVKNVAERFTPVHATAEQAGQVTRALMEKDWQSLPAEAKAAYSGMEHEVADNWQQLAPYDPQFVHRVSRTRATSIEAPRVGPVPVSLSQVQKRMSDFSPGIDDIAVATTHQGVEMLSRQGTDNLIDFVIQKAGRREADLMAEYAPHARDATSAANFEQQLQDVMGKRWRRFDPAQEGYNWNSAVLDKYSQDVHWIPEPLAKQLSELNKPRGTILSTIDPVTRTFRIAVVGLSPRTHLYNILGGFVMTFGETGPAMFKHMRRAWDMVKHPETIENEALRATIGGEKRSILDTDMARTEIASQYKLGQALRKYTDENSTLGKVANKSLDFNAKFDDMYRVTAYLYAHDKSLTRGLSENVARRAGEELMQKTMMDWAGMTPMERNLFKGVFPFYSFMRHAIKYVARYPVDHPLRAAVMGAFGKSEQDDLGMLPLSFLGSVPLMGDTRLPLTAINPFTDVPTLFTLQGWLGRTNPVINTALESVGVEQGGSELYPTLRYNPNTGRMDAVHENPLLAFVHNTVPQTGVLTSMLGINSQFNSQMGSDPAGASRSLLSAAGLPVLWRQQPVMTELLKAELARETAYGQVKNEALKTGDYADASRYPQFQQDLQALNQLPRQEREAMIPRRPVDLFQSVAQAMSAVPVTAASRAAETGGI